MATVSDALRSAMEEKRIDVDLSLEILDAFNRGDYDQFTPTEVGGIPGVDGESVVDFTAEITLAIPTSTAASRLHNLLPSGLASAALETGRPGGDQVEFSRESLRSVGLLLLPLVSYGVLNGGSATSYADSKKNQGFSPELYALLEPSFDRMADLCKGRPKGLTPAFLQPNGEVGPSFLELKMRNLLLLARESRAAIEAVTPGASDSMPDPLLPFFQMTSLQTHAPLATAYEGYQSSPLLRTLIEQTGLDPTAAKSAQQPLIAALTHSDQGRPKRVFATANGGDNEPLPLPGGHGQNFAVLSGIYRDLHASGKRFVYLGNVDNLGFLPSPEAIAYLALSGKQAGFDFAFKTPVDVKGGILVRDTAGRLTCADIGPAVSKEDVEAAEEAGTPILFNAASGLFSLDYLLKNLDRIRRELPTRVTDQNKDAGKYSQAEQVTWEVIGMLDDFVVFSVEKWDRLLAAKLLLETLMTSGIRLDDPAYATSDDPADDLRGTAGRLHAGLEKKLVHEYGMRLNGDEWVSDEESRQ